MSANLSATFYLISGILFILALRGLSSPETSRTGNFYGIIGMALAISVTILSVEDFSTGLIYLIICLSIGGSIGAFIAFKIPMTAMPELVAGFHSLVGLSAVFVSSLIGLSLSFDEYLLILITATIGSIGAAGVPSVALVMMTVVFTSVGIPLEAISLIVGVDRLLDMFRTALNVTGDLVITKIVNRFC